MRQLIYIFLSLILLNACSKEDLIDIFIGAQPDFYEEDNYDKQLNVFAILQADSSGGFSKSIFELSRTRQALNDTLNDSIVLSGSIVTLLKTEGQSTIDSIRFSYYNTESLIFDPELNQNSSFKLEEGFEYRLRIVCEGFSTLNAYCNLPAKPELATEITSGDENISFSLKNDTSIYLYEVFLVYNDLLTSPFRIEPQNYQEETTVVLRNKFPDKDLQKMLIYSYDKNLTTYYSFSNVFIKPNTYRPPFTTVEGAYGCFGAINELMYKF